MRRGRSKRKPSAEGTISIYSILLFSFALVLGLYLTTKINLNELSTTALGLTAISFGISGLVLKVSMGQRVGDVIIDHNGFQLGIIFAGVISFIEAILFLFGLSAITLGGLIVIVMAIMEEFFFTALYDIFKSGVESLYANLIVSVFFSLYHKAVYGLVFVVLLALFIGRFLLNIAYEKGGLDASITAHILINAIAILGGG